MSICTLNVLLYTEIIKRTSTCTVRLKETLARAISGTQVFRIFSFDLIQDKLSVQYKLRQAERHDRGLKLKLYQLIREIEEFSIAKL